MPQLNFNLTETFGYIDSLLNGARRAFRRRQAPQQTDHANTTKRVSNVSS